MALSIRSSLVLPWSVCTHENTISKPIWITLHILHVRLQRIEGVGVELERRIDRAAILDVRIPSLLGQSQ